MGGVSPCMGLGAGSLLRWFYREVDVVWASGACPISVLVLFCLPGVLPGPLGCVGFGFERGGLPEAPVLCRVFLCRRDICYFR